MQKRTLVLLLMGLLGCGPTDGPPVSGTVYPFPRSDLERGGAGEPALAGRLEPER
ncbi:hypothetical protein [Meiothermus taiwanensis]|uniref:hypothetical protein n=1 Tax=Meiothermus taiwanensis TaxID=172827 RepID=UPI001CBFF6C0|nr:hypothetical protein [Meiothermus taiwanensis]